MLIRSSFPGQARTGTASFSTRTSSTTTMAPARPRTRSIRNAGSIPVVPLNGLLPYRVGERAQTLPLLGQSGRPDHEAEMRLFVAGATGAVGKRLVPLLVTQGDDVVGMTRSPEKRESLRRLGAEAVVADGLDANAVREAVGNAQPEVVIHQMTALTGVKSFRKFDDEFALANRLRTEGTDHLLAAARSAGVRRFVVQSYGNWNYERTGAGPKTEDDPLDPNPPANQRRSLDAIRYLEEAVVGADYLEGLALRYGNFYGPGSGFALDGDLAHLVRKRRLPIVGDGAGVWSFIHLDDVATATLAAAERGAAGVYNVVDDEPAPVSVWLPEYARALGAKPPRHVPVWLGRLASGEVGVSMMTQIRGASNAKAKRELGWQPRLGSWREGFRSGLGDIPPPQG
jgi:nucleoside-diphosphate-sugar epimerase